MMHHVEPGARHRRDRRSLVAVAIMAALIALVLLVFAGAARLGGAGDEVTADPPTSGRSPTTEPTGRDEERAAPFEARWLRVLSALDARRAAAWRAGEPARLTSVYLAGSPVLAADQKMLSDYRRRGLSVSGVHVSYFVVDAQVQPGGAVCLLVVDRLGPAVVHDRSGTAETLPVDQPTRHRVVLRRVDGAWRIARISTV
jgi:hypothetical protein